MKTKGNKMSKKMTQCEAELKARECNIRLISKYINNKSKSAFKCLECNRVFTGRFSDIIKKGRQNCGRCNDPIVDNVYGAFTVLEVIENTHGGGCNVIAQCQCGKIIQTVGNKLTSGKMKSCGHCKDPAPGERFGFLTVVEVYPAKSHGCKILTVCDCGNFYGPVDGNNVTSGRVQSCGCLASCGNMKIRDALKKHNEDFEEEKSFDDLIGVNGGKLRFDFYLPRLNACIEFQGSQHYSNDKHFGGKRGLFEVKEHDIRKKEWCKKNNVELIEIPYIWEDNIEDIIYCITKKPCKSDKTKLKFYNFLNGDFLGQLIKEERVFGKLIVSGSIPKRGCSGYKMKNRDPVLRCGCGEIITTTIENLFSGDVVCCGKCEK